MQYPLLYVYQTLCKYFLLLSVLVVIIILHLSYGLFRWFYNIFRLKDMTMYYGLLVIHSNSSILHSILTPHRSIRLRERGCKGTIAVNHSERDKHVRVCNRCDEVRDVVGKTVYTFCWNEFQEIMYWGVRGGQ